MKAATVGFTTERQLKEVNSKKKPNCNNTVQYSVYSSLQYVTGYSVADSVCGTVQYAVYGRIQYSTVCGTIWFTVQ